jgi:hypothetical protein
MDEHASTAWNRKLFGFKNFVSDSRRTHNHEGVDGDGEPQKFVCREALNEYWKDTLGDLLKGVNLHLCVDAKEILESYLQVWSIVCYTANSCGDLHLIEPLTTKGTSDQSIPLSRPPFGWPCDKNSQDFMREFMKNQWMFAPLTFSSQKMILRRNLAKEQILPIEEEEVIRQPQPSEDYQSAVFKVKFHRCCISGSHPQTVILKSIGPVPGGHKPAEWESEASIYSSFRSYVPPSDPDSSEITYINSSPFDYIPAYLGSWNQGLEALNNKWTIMLEYATLGNLAKFCEREAETICAYPGRKKQCFWDGVLKDLLQGLICIHGSDW